MQTASDQAPSEPPRKKKKSGNWYKKAMRDLRKPSTTDLEKKEAHRRELAARPKMTFEKVERF